MYQGYIKLYRQIEEWEWYDDFLVFKLFIHLLLHANHQAKNWRGIAIQRGELITSYSQLTSQLTGKQQAKLGVQQIRTAIDKLKATGEITIKTNNKFSLIKLNNYDLYQSDNTPTNSPVTNEQQATNKQLTTNKNVKNEKNVKEERRFTPPSLSEVEEYIKLNQYNVDAEQWINFYQSKGWLVGKNKMKDWQAAVRTWAKRNKPETLTLRQDAINLVKQCEEEYGMEEGAEIAHFRFSAKHGKDETLRLRGIFKI